MMNIKPDVEQDPLLAAGGLRNGDEPPRYYSRHGRIVMSISIAAAMIVVGIRFGNSQHAKSAVPELPLIEESESKTCSPGYDLNEGDITGWGKVNGKGGGEKVDSCDDCAQLCSSEAGCLSFECSRSALKCNLNSAAAPSGGGYKDYLFCSKSCSPGYDLNEGDITGWGKVNGKGGGGKVDTCDDCAQLCNSEAGCLSFECSLSALKCNLNSAAAPSGGGYKDYLFCSKVEEPTTTTTVTTEAPKKALDNFEKFADQSCAVGFVSLSRVDSLEACASTCQTNAQCKFVSFCPIEASTCVGRNKGKCILSSRCETLGTKHKDYITYELNQA